MNKRKLQKLKSVTVKAIKAHLKEGGKLIANDFFLGSDPNKTVCKCPIQVVVESSGTNTQNMHFFYLSRILGFDISKDEMDAFIFGYDKAVKHMYSRTDIGTKAYDDLYNLGLEIRKQFRPLTKRQTNKIMGYEYV